MKTITISFGTQDKDAHEVINSFFEWFEENDCELGDLCIKEGDTNVNIAGLRQHYLNSIPRSR